MPHRQVHVDSLLTSITDTVAAFLQVLRVHVADVLISFLLLSWSSWLPKCLSHILALCQIWKAIC